jgi:lipopolysaccharide/colanic/teichoic acid biosynthesis glycosyltransferase
MFNKEEKPMGIETISVPVRNERRLSGLRALYIFFKDVIGRPIALFVTILLSPILILIAIGIRLDSTGNPIFSQQRTGKNGRSFTAYKFRTMHANNDDSEYKNYLKQYILKNAPYKVNRNGEPVFKLTDDPRITRVGSVLRRSNLDELPQLFNLIKGDMVLIGPRPDIPYSVKMYHDWHTRRLAVKPGITGLWQVANRRSLSFDDMVKLDIEYIERQSPLLDLKIIFLTIRTILRGDGS